MIAIISGDFKPATRFYLEKKMDIEQAKEEVSNIGESYFYDELDRYTVEEIINRIVGYILQATKLRGLHYSEVSRDAFFQILNELNQDELDKILLRSFALLPEQVGGSRAFFQRIASEMDKAIQIVKPKLTE